MKATKMMTLPLVVAATFHVLNLSAIVAWIMTEIKRVDRTLRMMYVLPQPVTTTTTAKEATPDLIEDDLAAQGAGR